MLRGSVSTPPIQLPLRWCWRPSRWSRRWPSSGPVSARPGPGLGAAAG